MRLKGSRFTHRRDEGCFCSDREKGRRRSPPFRVSLLFFLLELLRYRLRRALGTSMLDLIEKAASRPLTGALVILFEVSVIQAIHESLQA